MLDILQWVIDIVTLDARRMSAAAWFFSMLVFGGLSVVMTTLPLARLITQPSWTEAPALLLAFILGAGMLARLSYGTLLRWRGAATDPEDETNDQVD